MNNFATCNSRLIPTLFSAYFANQEMRTVLILQITLTIHHSLGEKNTERQEVLRTVFEDDPLVMEALAKEGSDWILAR